MEERCDRSKLRKFLKHPTIIERVVAAVSYAILGGFLAVIIASLIALPFYGAGLREIPYIYLIISVFGIFIAPLAWIIMGVSLAILPSEDRYRQMMAVAIFLCTGLFLSYLWQVHLPARWFHELRENKPVLDFQLFFRVTAVAIISTVVSGLILSKLTKNFKI